MRFISILVLAVTGLGLTGCLATSFSSLQGNYQTLATRQDQISRSGTVIDKDEVESGFAAIARDAGDLAAEADTPQTQVGILRLAAVSGWRAHQRGRDLALSLADKGQQTCKVLPPNQYGAPRDCGILLFIPDVVAWDELRDKVPPAPEVTDAKIAAWVAAVENNKAVITALATKSMSHWEAVGRDDGVYQGIAPAVREYLGGYIKDFGCWTYGLASKLDAIISRNPTVADLAKRVQWELRVCPV